MSMKLYDKDIACVMQNIKAYGECRRLDNNAHWKMNDKEKLVLRSDMAYELGVPRKLCHQALGRH